MPKAGRRTGHDDARSSHGVTAVKATSLNTLIQLVKGGMGTTLIPEMALEQLIKGNKNLSMTELDESGPHREIALIVRQNYYGERDAEILCSILKTELDIRFSKQ